MSGQFLQSTKSCLVQLHIYKKGNKHDSFVRMFIIGDSEGVSFKTRTHSTLVCTRLCNNVSVFPHSDQLCEQAVQGE